MTSDGQVIRYIEGFAWGITPTGTTVKLCTEQEAIEIIAGSRRLPSESVPAQIFKLERQLVKEEQKIEKKEQAKAREVKKERHERAVALGVAKTKRTSRLKLRKT